MKKKVKIIIILLLAILLASYIFIKVTKPLEVDTMKIQTHDIIRSFKETAKLTSENEISITPAYADEILYIIDEGKEVKKGDLLLTLSTKKLNFKKDELTAQINSLYGQEKMTNPNSNYSSQDIAIKMATDVLNRAKDDKQKFEILYENGAIAKTEYERYTRAYEDATNNLAKIKAAKSGSSYFYSSQRKSIQSMLKSIDDDLQYENIYANHAGVITGVLAKRGDIANPILPTIQMSDTNKLLAVCDIISSDALALKVGQTVTIDVTIGQETMKKTGEIVEIAKNAKTKISSLGLEEQRVKVKVKCHDIDNLIVGSDMDIIFETMHLKDKIVAPKTAVFKINDQDNVWIVKNGTLHIQPVELGLDSDYDYEVISGLTIDDIIVIDCNNTDLKEGKKIAGN